jgi:hypothetical protein
VPEITPLLLIVIPAGKEPQEMPQVYGVWPPVADAVTEYAVPTVPLGKLVVLIVRTVEANAEPEIEKIAAITKKITANLRIDI